MAGQYFIYIPFNDVGFQTEAANWKTIFLSMLQLEHAKALGVTNQTPQLINAIYNDPRIRKFPIIGMHGDPSLSLIRHASRSDTVYVMGHGCPNANTISDNLGNELDSHALVQRMLTDGVPTIVNKIKLWVCHGASGSSPFSQKFFPIMRASFPFAELTAYTKSLKVFGSRGHKRAIIGRRIVFGFPPSFKDVEGRASDYAVHYPPRHP